MCDPQGYPISSCLSFAMSVSTGSAGISPPISVMVVMVVVFLAAVAMPLLPLANAIVLGGCPASDYKCYTVAPGPAFGTPVCDNGSNLKGYTFSWTVNSCYFNDTYHWGLSADGGATFISQGTGDTTNTTTITTSSYNNGVQLFFTCNNAVIPCHIKSSISYTNLSIFGAIGAVIAIVIGGLILVFAGIAITVICCCCRNSGGVHNLPAQNPYTR